MNDTNRPRFCRACGGALENCESDARSRLVCTTCKLTHYAQLIVGAGGLIEVEDRLLLIKRADEPFKNSWCLPGGHVEYDEPPAAAAERETAEETGLKVAAGELVGAYFFDDHPAGSGVFLLYRCAIIGGGLKQTAEGLTPTFFGIDKIPFQLAGGGHRAAIEAWVNRASPPVASGGISINLQSQLSTVWNARYQQDQVLWRIFAAFWPTNAILLVALFRSSGQEFPATMGAITAGSGVFVAVIWFLIQRRALGHVKRIEATAERLEGELFSSTPAYALSPGINAADAKKLRGWQARKVMPLCTSIVGALWFLGLIYFVHLPLSKLVGALTRCFALRLAS